MSDKIQPALTAEEWAKQLGPQSFDDSGFVVRGESGVSIDHVEGGLACRNFDQRDSDFTCEPSARHALAALALYGQPFGFNDGHVLLLRTVARVLRKEGDAAEADHLDGLAGTIAALLPPP